MRVRVVTFTVAIALTLAACAGGNSETGNGDGSASGGGEDSTLTFAEVYGVSGFDPHKARSTADNVLLNTVYDRLFYANADGSAEPSLAESWEYDDEATTLTLTLRTDVEFHDGEPFDSDAVIANLSRAKEDDSITASSLSSIESMEAEDSHTVVLELSEPDTSLPLVLTGLEGMMVSPQAFGSPEKDDRLVEEPVGAGAYELTEATPGSQYEFEAVSDYWDEDLERPDHLVWEVMGDNETRYNALRSGQVNIAGVAPSMIDRAEQEDDLVVAVDTSLTQYVLFFNTNNGIAADQKIRQAIVRAIDRDAVIEAAFEGHATPATQPFFEGYFAHSPELEGENGYDPDAAKELIEEAEVSGDLTLELLVLNLPEYVVMAEVMQAQLAEVGISLEIDTLPPGDVTTTFNDGGGDAIMASWTASPDPSVLFNTYFGEGSPSNPSGGVPGVGEAVAQANSVTDEEDRGEAFMAASEAVAEHAAYAPIAFHHQGAVHSDTVEGFTPHLTGRDLRGAYKAE